MASCVARYRSLGTLAGLVASLATAGCTSLLGDFSAGEGGGDASITMDGTTTGGDDGSRSGEAGTLGAKCASTSECSAGQTCADGVCCESACDGVCESCNQPGAAGHCNPIPAMTDPDMECVMEPLPDAGADAAPAEAGADAAIADAEAGDAGDAALLADAAPVVDAAPEAAAESDAAPVEAGDQFNLPDAALVSSAGTCAGSCDGARKCAYPDHKTPCGTQFCNSDTAVGGFVCDGTGRCGPNLVDCQNYSCESVADGGTTLGACTTSCTQESDCSAGAFCKGGTCQAKQGNGLTCANANECQSGFCVTNGPSSVCCNQACDPHVVTGGTCSASGSVGTCTCPQCTGANNSCVLWYRDNDGDGYGDKFGTLAMGTAQVACSNDTPPMHWATNSLDCDDIDSTVNPQQTNFFTHPSGGGTYDYNCDGVLSKQLPEYVGASCGTCENNPSCGDFNCGSSTGATSLACHSSFICGILRVEAATGTIKADNLTVNPVLPITEYCCSSGTVGITSFSGSTTSPTGSCGVAGTQTTCGSCNGSGFANYSTAPVTQGCN
jgi:hypothetical protein